MLLAPESVLPMPLTERVVWLAVLNYVLVSHHFAAQHFGLLSLYRVRAGRASDAIARRLDRWFALVVGGGFVVVAEGLTGSIAFQDRWIDPLLGAGGSDVLARTLREGGAAQPPGGLLQRLLAPINRRGWAVVLVLAVVSCCCR